LAIPLIGLTCPLTCVSVVFTLVSMPPFFAYITLMMTGDFLADNWISYPLSMTTRTNGLLTKF
jgi:hypothetical protein